MAADRPSSPLTVSFQEFFRTEAAGGAVLVFCAAVAVLLANSSWSERYEHVLASPIALSVGSYSVAMTVHSWINDGLMAVFFLLVGLEIKREALAGELSSPRQAALPIAGAIGGMLLPAAIYWLTQDGGLAARGWAIPMATDIAFALGILALVAPQAPTGLKVFLAALAIVDDMGAVIVIAVFYTTQIAWWPAAGAALVVALLIGLNRLRVRHLGPYLALGLLLWCFVHASGIHATIAGVLLALTIPTRTRINAMDFSREARGLLDEFDRTETGDLVVLTSRGQQDALSHLEHATTAVSAPLLRLEHALQRFSGFVIMPLFALSNAGVSIEGSSAPRVTLAVILGLVIGKPLGITLAAMAMVRFRAAVLPQAVTWRALHGCAWLGGIGFTMSLFIATLAFEGTPSIGAAKLGILGGSVLAGSVGAILLRSSGRITNASSASSARIP